MTQPADKKTMEHFNLYRDFYIANNNYDYDIDNLTSQEAMDWFLEIMQSKPLYQKFREFGDKLCGIDKKYRHYEITLTTKPSTTKEELVKRIQKICDSSSVDPVHFEYVIEHEDSNLHSHIYIKTSKYIRVRDILRFNQNQRVSCKLVKNINAYKQYLQKENQSIILINSLCDNVAEHAEGVRETDSLMIDSQ